MQKVYCFLCFIFSFSFATAQKLIKVDQFGYLPNGTKIAVVSKPTTGFNGGSTFTPGTGTNQYQVRRVVNNSVAFTGTLSQYKSGITDTLSGDKGWYFNFSSLTTPDAYYIYDMATAEESHPFIIDTNVYNDVLKTVGKYYYYNRCGSSKLAAYSGNNWTDAACHINSTNQDVSCRLYSSPSNTTTNKDLSGGWHDAGDYNKYVNFSYAAVLDLLHAYLENPIVFTDNTNIPESGNGIPDILDEVKYELDWIIKMQQTNGSVLSVVGVQNFASASPPSADAAQRLYGPATTSASYSTAAMFALAAKVFSNFTATTSYATSLQAKAISAYTWATNNPAITFYNAGVIAAGEQELNTYQTNTRRLAAAVYLYALTGTTTYKTYIDANYTTAQPMQWYFWYQFEAPIQDALLYYANLTGANTPTASVATAINSNFITSLTGNNPASLPAAINQRNLYAAFMNTWDYTWNSNNFIALQAIIMNQALRYNLSTSNHTAIKKAMEGYMHYYHGVNPLDKVYISNMNALGAENSVNEFYHAWFADGTSYDNVQTSLFGPPPGFIPSGANPTYSLDACCATNNCGSSNSLCNTANFTPPLGQPAQKSYKDFNTTWPVNSWEITEVGIYTQASYIRLLSKYASFNAGPLNINNVKLYGSTNASNYNLLQWDNDQLHNPTTLQKSIDGQVYTNLINQCELLTNYTDKQNNTNGTTFYRLALHTPNGVKYSNVVSLGYNNNAYSISPNPCTNTINIITANKNQLTFTLINNLGNTVLKGLVANNKIDVQQLPAGLYILNVEDGVRKQTFKVVKM
jgi:endoglucanase